MLKNLLFLKVFFLVALFATSVLSQDQLVVPSSGNSSATTCNAILRDHAGTGNYNNNVNGVITITPATSGSKISITGSYAMENWYDNVYIYNGPTETSLLGQYTGIGTIPTITSTAPNGELTIRFITDVSVTNTGLEFNVSCVNASGAYSATYNGNGNTSGVVPVDNSTYSSGGSVTVAANSGSLAKTGYTFAGWNTASDGSGTSYLPGSTFAINSNTILYAQWALNSSSSGCFPDGNALGFSGDIYSGAKVTFVGSTFDFVSSPVTIESWIYYTGGNSIQTIVSTSNDGGGGQGGYALMVNTWNSTDGKLILQTKSNALSTVSNNVIPLNTWTHVAAVITSSSTAKLFVNGVELATTGGVNYQPSGLPFCIGALQSLVYHFNGKMDELRIWNTDRSLLINSTYNSAVSASSTGLVGYFKMDQGVADGTNSSITSLTNSVSGGTNGSLNGFALSSNSASNFTTSACINSSPSIVVSSNLSVFSKCAGVASTPQSFTVSGTSISSGVTIAVPDGFEVSTSFTFDSNVGNNTTPLVVSASGTLASTTIHVRMQSSANNASYAAANIVLSSAGATSQNVSCQGTTTIIPTIATTTPGSRCATGTVSLGATASAGTINWYSAATGGTSLSTGTSFTTGSISSTTTYYVDATNNGCTTATRSSVVATVNSIPTISSVTPGTRCGTGSVSLGAAASAGTINWYLVSTGGTSQGTGTSFSTGSISSTTTYYVDATSNGCTTTSRTSVTATVNGLPTITNESLSTQTVCQNIAFSPMSVTATGTGLTYQWYSNSTASNSGGSVISGATNASYTPPSSALGTMYYYCIVSGTCTPAATSSVSGVFAVQGPLAGSIAITGSSAICTGTSKNLSLSGHSGSIQWQSSTNNSTWSDISGSTSPIFNTGNLTATTYFRANLSFGSCTPVYTSSQLITVDPLSVAGTISGSAGVCSGSTSTLTLTGNTGTIVWTSSDALNGTYTAIGGATSSPYTTAAITAATYYKAVVTSGVCPSSTTAAYTVSTTPLGNIGSISGPSPVTLGGTATYSVTSVTNATSYVWNLPAGMTLTSSANDGASITVSIANNFAGGTLTAQAVGCTNSSIVSKVVNAPSAATLSITTTTSGAPVFCGGTTASFSTTTTSTNNTATYLWTLPTGVSVASGSSLTGSAINVVFAANYNGGTISVTRVSSTESLIAYYTVGAIATPGVITGPSTLCGASSGTYSIASVSGANSYEWSLPTGMTGTSTSTSINVSWTGSITGNVQVRAVKNSCGTSAWRTLSVASVATPGAITGPTTTCGANSNTISASGTNTTTLNTATYSISAVTGATGYTWTVPTGMAITSGQGTTSINVTITPSSFTSGSVTVVATTSTCTSAVRSLSISSANSTIVGPTDLCGLSQATYSINAPSGATVTWTLADWMSLASGQTLTSNPITVNIGAAPSQQNITASYSTSCGTVTGSRFVGCNSFTQLENTYCGGSVSNATQVVLAQYIGSGSYKFEVSGGSIGSTASILTQSWNGFTFAQIPGILPGTYSVKVSFKPTGSGTFGSFGSTCSVTLGSDVPSTEVISSQCGSTVSTLTTVVSATYKGAGTYQFVISGNGLGSPVTLTQSWNGFTFAQIPGVLPGSYNVKVNYKPTGYSTYGPDGQVCSVTLGSDVPSTEVISSQCGSTVSTLTTVVSATYKGAGTYQFVISGNGLGSPVTLTQSWNGFTFAQIPGVLPGSYNVKVNYKPTGYSTYGPDGQVCSVTLGSDVPSTEVISSQCGSTVSTLTTVVSATYKGAGTYQFVISGNGLGSPVTLTQSWNGFTFAQIPGVLPGSYNVKVNYKPTGYSTYGPDGQVCSVTLGSDVPSTEVISSQCGSTVSTLTTVVSATYKGAGTYQFVISGNGLGSPVTLTQSWNGFTFAQIPGILPGSYNVKVNYKPTGYSTYGPDGQVCSVTLGSDVPSTEIEACGSSGINGMSTIVFATYKGAGTYEFVINHASFTSPVTLTQSWNGFMFSQVPGAIYGGYSITVRYKPTGYSSFGQPTTCNSLELLDPGALVTQGPQLHEEATEGIQTEEDATETTASLTETPATTTWTATATSNPFEHSFKVNLNGSEAIEIAAMFTATLTDMSGKVYTTQTLSKEALTEEHFGQDLAPGMYLMTLRQGEELRVLRLVKR